MNITIPSFLNEVVGRGVNVTIVPSADYSEGYYFDLNLMAKSHMYLFHEDGKWYVNMRYGVCEEVSSLYHLAVSAQVGMHYKGFVSEDWYKIIKEFNL